MYYVHLGDNETKPLSDARTPLMWLGSGSSGSGLGLGMVLGMVWGGDVTLMK